VFYIKQRPIDRKVLTLVTWMYGDNKKKLNIKYNFFFPLIIFFLQKSGYIFTNEAHIHTHTNKNWVRGCRSPRCIYDAYSYEISRRASHGTLEMYFFLRFYQIHFLSMFFLKCDVPNKTDTLIDSVHIHVFSKFCLLS